MTAQLVRIRATGVPEIFAVTPIDTGARPEHPIFYPPEIWGPNDPRPTPPIYIPPEHSERPRSVWVPTEAGWYLSTGPFDKPRPLPPGFEGGKWHEGEGGAYYVIGPYDKPRPLPPGKPEQPPDGVPPGEKPNGRWVFTQNGWYWAIGPFDKPRPV